MKAGPQVQHKGCPAENVRGNALQTNETNPIGPLPSLKKRKKGLVEATELVAIRLALEHAHHRPEDAEVITTDSRAALQVLRQPRHTDNVGLVTAVLASLQGLAEQRRRVRLHCAQPRGHPGQ